MEPPIKDKYGFYIYEHLPEGSQLISLEMYDNGFLKFNAPYLIYSIAYSVYECHRVNENTAVHIIPFLESNRVYSLPVNRILSNPQSDINARLQLEF
ncbi:MAG: hypothetical protein ACOYOV_14745 [Bacteroidales bacterium]|jgi:hypothetical protein